MIILWGFSSSQNTIVYFIEYCVLYNPLGCNVYSIQHAIRQKPTCCKGADFLILWCVLELKSVNWEVWWCDRQTLSVQGTSGIEKCAHNYVFISQTVCDSTGKRQKKGIHILPNISERTVPESYSFRYFS